MACDRTTQQPLILVSIAIRRRILPALSRWSKGPIQARIFASTSNSVSSSFAAESRPQPELCTRSVGLLEDLLCDTDSRTLVDLHLRRITYPQAVRAGRVRFDGPPELQRRFVHWFKTSPFADYLPGAHAVPQSHQETDN